MTETGRDVVERLQYELDFQAGRPRVTRDDLRALLAVVEAAQELRQALARERGGGTPLTCDEYLSLHTRSGQALAALHSQASDEGKA